MQFVVCSFLNLDLFLFPTVCCVCRIYVSDDTQRSSSHESTKFKFAWPSVIYSLLCGTSGKYNLNLSQTEAFMAAVTDTLLESWSCERDNMTDHVQACIEAGKYGIFSDRTASWNAFKKIHPTRFKGAVITEAGWTSFVDKTERFEKKIVTKVA